MDFAWAISAIKAGLKVTRNGWNGKSQYIELATCVSYKNTQGEIVNVNHETMGNKAIAFVGTSGVQLGWLASQSDMLSDDWQIYFGEGHEKQTPEEIEAYKKLMLDNMPGSPAFHERMLDLDRAKMEAAEQEAIGKLPKAGSMENCEILSNAINQLLESIGVMPHLTVTLVPGPEDKELLISIEERSDHGASNFPLYVADVGGIIKTNIGSPVKSIKTVAGGYEVEDMQSNLGKED